MCRTCFSGCKDTFYISVFSRPFYLPKKMDEETFEKYRLLIENHLFKLRKMAKELAQN